MLNLYTPSLRNLSNNFIWSASLLVHSPAKISETSGSSLCFNFRWRDICDCNSPQNGHGFLPAKIADTSDLSLCFSFMCLASCVCNTPQYGQGLLTRADVLGCSSSVGEELGQSLLGKYPLSLCFSEVDFLGCSSSSAGHVWSDLGEDPAEWRFSEADCCGCSSSTGEKLGHSKLEGGSTLSCINDNEFLVAHYSLGED